MHMQEKIIGLSYDTTFSLEKVESISCLDGLPS